MPRRQQDQDDEGFGEASRYTAHLDRGWSLLDRGDLQRARNSAHQALKIRPEVPDGAMLMAAISLAESDPESSLEWYERAIDADSEYVDAQLAAAQLLLYDLDDPQRALSRAEIARELDEATLVDQIDLGLLEIEALLGMSDHPSASERLGLLAELYLLEQLLSEQTPRDELGRLLREFAGEAHDLDADDMEQLMGRIVQLAVRVARLHMDLGAPEAALPWLDGLLRRFGDDADVWYLTNEAAYMAGEPIRAAHAALQVLQLDATSPLADWSPEPAELHAKVVDLLVKCLDPQLRALAREPGFVVVVNEGPPFELVLEGVDPRARALALAARNIRDIEAAPTLTGLALYRRNLIRLSRDQAQLDRELQLAVFDELAVFFDFDDARRERLGLAPSDAGALFGDLRPLRRELDPASDGDLRRRLGKLEGDGKADGRRGTSDGARDEHETEHEAEANGANGAKPAAKQRASKKPAAKPALIQQTSKKAAKKAAAKKTAAAQPSPAPAKKPAAKKTAATKPSPAAAKKLAKKPAKKAAKKPAAKQPPSAVKKAPAKPSKRKPMAKPGKRSLQAKTKPDAGKPSSVRKRPLDEPLDE